MSTSGMSKLDRLPIEDRSVQCTFISFIYYQAIRDRKPVWKLEDMRTMETFFWDRQHRRRTYTPSEALLYAIVHDHQAYALYLLSHYSAQALAMPSKYFCCCAAQIPHLAMAVRYERKYILELILQVVHQVPNLRSCLTGGQCFNSEDGKTPLHLACELLNLETIVLLLGNGASPLAEDRNGMTPLDLVLEQLWNTKVNVREKKRCLDNLLLFMPETRFKTKLCLENNPIPWTEVLGQDTFNYLVGKFPARLLFIARKKMILLLPTDQFQKSLRELPIPNSLKTLPVSSQH